MPKYRGDSDDWYDDRSSQEERRSQHRKQKKKKSGAAVRVEPDLANATVVEVHPKLCRVRMDAGEVRLCQYRRSGVFQESEAVRERTPTAVGDRVVVESVGASDGVVESLARRKNFLARPAPGKEGGQIHVLAANLDLLVIVASVKDPVFSPGLVDRFLVAATAAKIPTLICANKIDLVEGAETPDPSVITQYRGLGLEIIEVSAHSGAGVPELKDRLRREGRVAFCGHSGVGKTSLLQSLLEHDVGRVGEVSEVTGKGKHTTTSSSTYRFEKVDLIDTPGVREFGLYDVHSTDLLNYFPEMSQAEPEASFRFESYSRIRESLEELEAENE